MKEIVLFILRVYKRIISPILVPVFGNACRFTPTCSEYTIESVKTHGVVKGLYKGFVRITKCNPWFN